MMAGAGKNGGCPSEKRTINKSLTKLGPIENRCSRWTTKFRSFGPSGALVLYRTIFVKNWKKLEEKPVHGEHENSIGPTEKPIDTCKEMIAQMDGNDGGGDDDCDCRVKSLNLQKTRAQFKETRNR